VIDSGAKPLATALKISALARTPRDATVFNRLSKRLGLAGEGVPLGQVLGDIEAPGGQ